MKNILIIVGTNSQTSTNRQLADFIKNQYKGFDLIDLKNLPIKDFESSDIDMNISNLTDKIMDSDGILICSPEYIHAPTAALLNFLDWCSHIIHPFENKAVGLLAASHGQLAAIKSLAILRNILISPKLKAKVFDKNFFVTNSKSAFIDGQLSIEKTEELDAFISEFLEFIDK